MMQIASRQRTNCNSTDGDVHKLQRKDQFNKLLAGKRYYEALAANFTLQLTPIPAELSPGTLRDHFARVEASEVQWRR